MRVENFREKMNRAVFNPRFDIKADGNFHRFSTNGKPDDDAGWYVLNEYPIAVGAFGCWRSGLTVSWSGVEQSDMTQEDRKKYKQAFQQMNQINDEEKAKANLEAAENAQKFWNQANEASSTHPYLVSKKVNAFSIKNNGQRLLIPLRNGEV